MGPRTVVVLATGPAALFQDLGRPGYAHMGVPRSGAADRGALATANQLLGNAPSAAAIECLFGGLSLRAEADLELFVAGAPAPATAGGAPVPHATRFELGRGEVFTLGFPLSGARAYVAVRGGFEPPATLGSRSTCTLSALGPGPIRAGDRVPVGDPPSQAPAWDFLSLAPSSAAQAAVLRGLRGPRAERAPGLDPAVGFWTVQEQSDRVGVRLRQETAATRADPGTTRSGEPRVDGMQGAPSRGVQTARNERVREARSNAAGRRADPGTTWGSEPLAHGSVQATPSGELICFLADHPTTGGYPVVCVLEEAAVNLLAQLRPGSQARFELA